MVQITGLLMAVLLLAAAPMAPAPPRQQDLWGTAVLPGGVSAARTVVDLAGAAGRIDEFLLVDFAHRFHGAPGDESAPNTLRRYVTLLEQIITESTTWREGFALPAPTAARTERDRARRFLELLGLVLVDNATRVDVGRSREAKERQAWLAAAGVDTSTLVEPLNAGASVVVTIPNGELPLPLPGFWAPQDAEQSPLLSITGLRESALLYTGLLSVDTPTLQYLDANRTLLMQIRTAHAAAFAAFARSIQIRDGAVLPAGGVQGARVWERLTGARLAAPASFLPALLSKDEGRLAWFYDTVAQLDLARQAWLLGEDADAIYHVFRRIAPKWTISERPFVRPALDPLMVLSLAARDDSGFVSSPWWRSLFENVTRDPGWPRRGALTMDLPRDEPLDAHWLLSWVFARDVEEAVDRFRMFRLAQRMFPGVDRSAAQNLGTFLGAVRDLPTLPPALERMGITDLGLAAQLVQAARGFGDEDDDEDLARLARWQLMFALVEQVAVRQRLPPARTGPLLKSLLDWAPATGREADGLAAVWLVNVFLPAVVPDVPIGDLDDYERDVAIALAKRPGAEQGAHAIKVFWEGIEYVVDDTFAATRDVVMIRRSQSSPALGDVIRAHRLLQRLEAGLSDLGEVATVSTEFTRVLAAMTKIQLRDGREIDAVADMRKAARSISRISNERDIPKATQQIPRLRAALDAIVDGGVLPLVYALAVSPAGVTPAALVELPFRHTWESGKDAAGKTRPFGWRPAQVETGPALENIVRGSVLGLDVSMGHGRLRATGRSQPPERSALMSAGERAAVFRVMRAHGEVVAWGTDAARVLKALDAGDAIIAGRGVEPASAALAFEDRLRAAGIDPARISIARWQRNRGVPVDQLAFSRLDAYRLGSSEPLPAGWEGAGAGASVATDVLLRLLTASRALKIPAAMVPALLPLAAHDWLADTPQFPRTLTRDRVEAYVLALVSGRVLVRPQRSKDQ